MIINSRGIQEKRVDKDFPLYLYRGAITIITCFLQGDRGVIIENWHNNNNTFVAVHVTG